MYAIVKVGGHQYRVEEGDSLLVDRLRADEGATVVLDPVLLRDDEPVLDADALANVKVSAVVRGHERGEKVHVLKFKPKRGYKRRMGHRSELTRLEISEISGGSRGGSGKRSGGTRSQSGSWSKRSSGGSRSASGGRSRKASAGDASGKGKADDGA